MLQLEILILQPALLELIRLLIHSQELAAIQRQHSITITALPTATITYMELLIAQQELQRLLRLVHQVEHILHQQEL